MIANEQGERGRGYADDAPTARNDGVLRLRERLEGELVLHTATCNRVTTMVIHICVPTTPGD